MLSQILTETYILKSPNWKQSQGPSTREGIDHQWYIHKRYIIPQWQAMNHAYVQQYKNGSQIITLSEKDKEQVKLHDYNSRKRNLICHSTKDINCYARLGLKRWEDRKTVGYKEHLKVMNIFLILLVVMGPCCIHMPHLS